MSAELIARLGIDGSRFENGLRQAGNRVENFARSAISRFGAIASVGGFTLMAKQAMELGEKIDDMSQKFKISGETLQRLGNVANVSGSSMEDVAKALNKLKVNQQDAVLGNKKLAEAFARAGISVQELQSLDAEGLFLRLSEAVANGTLKGQEFITIQELMGKSATNLIPMMEKGADAIRAQGEAMGVISNETLAQMAQMNAQLKTMQSLFMTTFAEAFVKLEPIVTFIFTMIKDIIIVLGEIPNFLKALASFNPINVFDFYGKLGEKLMKSQLPASKTPSKAINKQASIPLESSPDLDVALPASQPSGGGSRRSGSGGGGDASSNELVQLVRDIKFAMKDAILA